MITKITGKLTKLLDERAIVEIHPIHLEVWIPEYTRRQLQQEIGNEIRLHTLVHLDGNMTQGKVVPRLLGFLSEAEREFFDLFCIVDGVGPKKALRAMVRPVREIAAAIEEQDVKFLSGLPGIGPSTAERIVAKLRRKVPKFALIAKRTGDMPITSHTLDVITETFEALVALGNSEAEARRLIDKGTEGGKKKFKDSASLIEAIYKNKDL
jgi:Holliday junction DNA helicase RuvA